MRLLWIATKPPVPPVDGGRLAALLTIQALARAGAEVTVVAPVLPNDQIREIELQLASSCRAHLVRSAPRRRLAAALLTLAGGPPYSVARHRLPEVRAEVERLLAAERFDAVHAEQLQAFAQAGPALRRGIPVVLRAQNVESDLWRATARLHPWTGPWLAREVGRLARYEGAAVRRAATTVALTERDAARLRELGGPAARVATIPPPFPAALPPGERKLPGEPPLVLLGSGGWLPNREGTRWFLAEAWPEVRAGVPGAILHVFAFRGELPRRLPAGIEAHAPPADSREAFAPKSILVVPLRIASGIRMKILEAWARGVPVVATPEAAEGLVRESESRLRIARTAGGFVEAIAHLTARAPDDGSPGAGAPPAFAAVHDPSRIAARLLAVYEGAARRTPSDPP